MNRSSCANGLIEQLWMAATQAVEPRHAAPLRSELASVQEAVATGLARIRDLEAACLNGGHRRDKRGGRP